MSANVPAVLLLNFNRPDLTAGLIDCLRPVKPPRVYFAVDGPRASKPGEAAQVQAVQACAARIDWPCEVHTLFRDQNLGCRPAVSQAISWFFTHEEAGIILEDDCHPVPAFFGFCAELLERYRADMRVFSISGFNLLGQGAAFPYSYWFHRASVCWGWASWRDRWACFNEDKQLFDQYLLHNCFEAYFNNGWQAEYYKKYLSMVFDGQLSSWAYLWTFTHIVQGAYSIVPRTTLVQNKGLETETATHAGDIHKRIHEETLHHNINGISQLEMIHPSGIVFNERYEHKLEDINVYRRPSLLSRVKQKLR